VASPAITIDGVWKKFRRGERHDSLRDLIPAAVRKVLGRGRGAELGREEFWAVRDISFEVSPGEALAIVGHNGAGKSTLLKLLTRILRPTKGRCEVRGRVGALIEVAAGFHPDLTGRENVYLQGAIMGMPRAEIARKFDEIVEFSGISEFIDTQVKRYSSGMNARLGFAIAAHLDPDVLLIDEVLSVGDAAFQDRCIARMRTLLDTGIPLVFITHNLAAAIDLCTRAVVIDRGAMVFDGAPVDAVATYRRMISQGPVAGHAAAKGPIRITSVELGSDDAATQGVVASGGRLRVRIGYEALEPTRAHFAIDIETAQGVFCTGLNSAMDNRDFGVLHGEGAVEFTVPRLPLLAGSYLTSIGILEPASLRAFDLRFRAFPLTVSSQRPDYGIVHLERTWEHLSLVTADDRPAGGRRAHLQPQVQTGAL
jgi:lipopolysaccharide transport system ATP-binding protein